MPSKNTKLRNEQEEAKRKAFVEAMNALEKEHGLRLEPIIYYSPNRIEPQIVVVPIETSESVVE